MWILAGATRWLVNGDRLRMWPYPSLEVLRLNSPDMNGDLVVNLIDVVCSPRTISGTTITQRLPCGTVSSICPTSALWPGPAGGMSLSCP